MKLEEKVAIVTGASRGIGRATALKLAEDGAAVAINYRSHPEEAQQVADQIAEAGGQAILLQGDVADFSAVQKIVEDTVKRFGRLDIFISNAAYSERELMVEADMDAFKRTVDVTMWGAFYGLRTAAQKMIEQKIQGSIVIVSSPHAVIPFPTAMAYNMSKAAIDHMARTAAMELAPHRIRVNLVHPGWIDTPGERQHFTEEQIAAGGKKLPFGRLGTPEEIAKGIAFICSDDMQYMTGSTTLIDGGVSLPWWSNRAGGEM